MRSGESIYVFQFKSRSCIMHFYDMRVKSYVPFFSRYRLRYLGFSFHKTLVHSFRVKDVRRVFVGIREVELRIY